MKRVTGSRVVKAYKATGFKPIQDEFYLRGVRCVAEACALSALAAFEQGATESELEYDALRYGTAGTIKLKLPEDYFIGFTSGWDDESMNPRDLDRAKYEAGYQDGVKARKAVVKAGLAEFQG